MAAKQSLSREASLNAKPVATKILERHELPDGGARLVFRYQPTRMQRLLLRIPDTATRKYEMDLYGLQVLELCDGQRNVKHIIKRFAKDHSLDPREAERAVLKFLEILVRKGLVEMIVTQR
jgi:hypothetical protein